LAEAFTSGDLLAFPSTTDTLGLVLLEAAAAGLPVLAVSSPAAEEVLRGLEGVALVPAEDGRGLVAAAERLGRLGVAERSALAARARDGIASWARSTDLLVGYYREAIARSLSRWPAVEAAG
jgi:glycosyltransferase involved in cell wall biosynthesis